MSHMMSIAASDRYMDKRREDREVKGEGTGTVGRV